MHGAGHFDVTGYVMRTPQSRLFQPERPRAFQDEFHHTMQAHFKAHAPFYGVNAETLISGDVLSQYSKLITLFELFPGAPHTIAPYLFNWEAKSYVEALAESEHPARDFLIAAACHVPAHCGADFCTAMHELETTAMLAIDTLKMAMMHGRAHEARDLCRSGAEAVRQKIETAAAIAWPPDDATVTPGWRDVEPRRAVGEG